MIAATFANRAKDTARRECATWAVLFALLVLIAGCGKSPQPSSDGNLLSGRQPVENVGVSNADRLTDSIIAEAGDHWETNLTAVFRGLDSHLVYDLGGDKPIEAIYLQGDNNDRFEVWLAGDDKNYRRAWTAPSVDGAGMRERFGESLGKRARYLKIVPRPGDPAVSASEVQVFSSTPTPFPPNVATKESSKRGEDAEHWWLWFTVAASALLLTHKRHWARPVLWGAGLGAVAMGCQAIRQTAIDWPVTDDIINMMRVAAAVISGAAVVRLVFFPKGAVRKWITGSLATMAVLAMAAFYNAGYPQFLDVANDGRTHVHTWDMRVYFPTAKYFEELGFDGLYLASVKAYAEDVPGSLPHRIAHVELRDLNTYEMTRVRDVLPQIDAIKDRFSPERWEEFRNDMAYFRETMGPGGYLGSLRDHGGNATPAWMLLAHLMFRNATANQTTLLLAGALDPLLLLAFFIAVWRTFNLRTACVCIVVYGTSTFPWFGSNWAGSTLRNDWMVLLGLGICALKTKRPFLGGLALGGAAMIRAFPAMAVFALPLPALWWVFEYRTTHGKLPGLGLIRSKHGALLRAIAGAAVCVAVTAGASTAAFGFQKSWGTWAHKISMHSTQPNVNHVGLRTAMSYDSDKTIEAMNRNGGGNWSREQVRTWKRRMPFFVILVTAYSIAAVCAARRQRLHQAAVIGLMLIPIYFYPSNYYLHYVFVIPLLVDWGAGRRRRRQWGLICLTLLAMSAIEYFGFETPYDDQRYAEWSFSALVGYAVILGYFARERMRKPLGLRGKDAAAAELGAPATETS